MARGRMISSSLGSSRKFHALLGKAGKLGEFAQALFPLIVSHSDDFGRLEGDPFTIKHKVLPTSPRSESDFQKVIDAMCSVGLIYLYTVNEVTCIQIVGFDDHQSGLHKRTKSKFPEPPGNSGKLPEIPSEEKRTEENGTEPELKGREGPAASRGKGRSSPVLPEDEFLDDLQKEPAYQGIDVRREYEKAVVWCKANNREPTRRFLVNWLNRADRSLGGGNGSTTSYQQKPSYSQRQSAAIRAALGTVGLGQADNTDALGVERRLQAPDSGRGGTDFDSG